MRIVFIENIWLRFISSYEICICSLTCCTYILFTFRIFKIWDSIYFLINLFVLICFHLFQNHILPLKILVIHGLSLFSKFWIIYCNGLTLSSIDSRLIFTLIILSAVKVAIWTTGVCIFITNQRVYWLLKNLACAFIWRYILKHIAYFINLLNIIFFFILNFHLVLMRVKFRIRIGRTTLVLIH